MEFLRRNWPSSLLIAIVLFTLAWASLAPLRTSSRDRLLEIPKGTWDRRAAGDKAEVLPATVRLTLGVRDVLLLRNSDTVPHAFGPVQLVPGQELRLPFEAASANQIAFSARVSGKTTVLVEPLPNPGLPRLRWRLTELWHAILAY